MQHKVLARELAVILFLDAVHGGAARAAVHAHAVARIRLAVGVGHALHGANAAAAAVIEAVGAPSLHAARAEDVRVAPTRKSLLLAREGNAGGHLAVDLHVPASVDETALAEDVELVRLRRPVDGHPHARKVSRARHRAVLAVVGAGVHLT